VKETPQQVGKFIPNKAGADAGIQHRQEYIRQDGQHQQETQPLFQLVIPFHGPPDPLKPFFPLFPILIL
jgi:hypothetical protein